ncbi:MAG: NAD(P)-binding protein [Betaproteobacteria bacterium]|nr:NAD(P)-binding protein [Betaproteobacteria bacterium]
MERRKFLVAGAAAVAATACGRAAAPLPPGELHGSGHAVGHRLRDGSLPLPGETRRRRVLIVGAGIAGLSAAWRLRKAGFDDFELLELDAVPGGNSRWGENEVSRYPWGAHYLPLPTRESRAVRLLLSELGVLRGDPRAEFPEYDERALCFAPQERLYYRGTWQEGLTPGIGASSADRSDWRRFQDRMEWFKHARGTDGRKAFAIPMARSSRDASYLVLDRVSMRDWLVAEGHASPAVHWLVDYACRDDYGCDYREASAWAGIHYFASRDGVARDSQSDAVLTWPEGNGWLVARMVEKFGLGISTGSIVHRVVEGARGVDVSVYVAAEDRSVAIRAEEVIWAAPLRFAARALGPAGEALRASLGGVDYAPWLTANLTLAEHPYERHGAPLAWDNVLHASPSVGYVVATHQRVTASVGPTVLTYYWPLVSGTPAEMRRRLIETSRETWVESILADLSRPHPEIRATTRRVDVFANGHAMIRPRPGFITGAARARLLQRGGRVHWAHADVSGFSIFEEAQYRGVAAAERVLERLGSGAASIL